MLVSLLVVGAMVMALVSMQALVAQRSFQVQELHRQAEELSAEYERLRLQLAEVSMPDRVQAAAEKAGLVLHERLEVLDVPRSPRGRRVLASAGESDAVKAALGAGG